MEQVRQGTTPGAGGNHTELVALLEDVMRRENLRPSPLGRGLGGQSSYRSEMAVR